MLASASGRIDFTVAKGTSRVLIEDASAKALKFQELRGAVEFDPQLLRVLPSKFKADNRIYEMSGTVSLVDKQAQLRLSNSGEQWAITGDLDKPRVAAQPLSARDAVPHSQ